MILDYFNVRKLVVVATVAWVGSFQLWGQSVIRTSSTEKAVWQQSKDRLKKHGGSIANILYNGK